MHMLKIFYFCLINLFTFCLNAQTLTGNYTVQKFKGVGDDDVLNDKSKEVDIYKYIFSNSKSEIVLTNPKGTRVDTLKGYYPSNNFHYETIDSNISFSKAKCVKDLKNGFYEKFWIINGEEIYKKEKFPEINWTLINETKTIEGFLCRKATAFHTTEGYTFSYYAWYCDEITVNDGPFEYGGLPGFILELGIKDFFVCKFINYNYDENLITKIDFIK